MAEAYAFGANMSGIMAKERCGFEARAGMERSAEARDWERTAHRTGKEERRRVRSTWLPRCPEAPVKRTRGGMVGGMKGWFGWKESWWFREELERNLGWSEDVVVNGKGLLYMYVH
jgi:hypothetical protein